MKYRVRITRRALADADETHAWIEENVSRTIADQWYAGLLDEIEKPADHPLLHPKAMESDDHPVPIREALYGGRKSEHRILDTVQDDEAVILYIHHSSRGRLEP